MYFQERNRNPLQPNRVLLGQEGLFHWFVLLFRVVLPALSQQNSADCVQLQLPFLHSLVANDCNPHTNRLSVSRRSNQSQKYW